MPHPVFRQSPERSTVTLVPFLAEAFAIGMVRRSEVPHLSLRGDANGSGLHGRPDDRLRIELWSAIALLRIPRFPDAQLRI